MKFYPVEGVPETVPTVVGIVGAWTTPWKEAAWARVLDDMEIAWAGFSYADYFHSQLGLWQQRFQFGPDVLRMNRELIAWVYATRPQVVLVWNGLSVWPTTVEKLQQVCWATCYTNDDPFGRFAKNRLWRHFWRALPYYDSHHVYRHKNVKDYLDRGIAKVGLLRSYAVPWLNYPDPDPERFLHDVVFVGHCEPDRVHYISYLVDRGIDVKVYGPPKSWSKGCPSELMSKVGPIRELGPDDYRKALSTASICLAFLSKGNNDTYTRRCFEIPACGGFMLAERTDDLQELYQEEIEAEFFSSPEELYSKVCQYLKDDVSRRTVSTAGRERYLRSGYDVSSVVRKWLREIEHFSGLSLVKHTLKGFDIERERKS